jgi:hypothetical protein
MGGGHAVNVAAFQLGKKICPCPSLYLAAYNNTPREFNSGNVAVGN